MQDHSGSASGRSESQHTYRLLEIHADGREISEGFSAPDDDVALERALSVGVARTIELWRGAHLLRRWTKGEPGSWGPGGGS